LLGLRPWHRAQMGVYFLLAEERFRVKPAHGFIVCGDGSRHRIDNDGALRAWVLDLAGQIRAARATVAQPIIGNRSANGVFPADERIASLS
jgi:CRISPR-associated exonuclease Cas4